MALLTLAEVKAFLREGSTNYDSLITAYIPIIEQDICRYLDNYFEDKAIYVEAGSGLAFVNGTSRDYITDDQAKFSTVGLTSGMDIAVRGGSNHGIYSISSGQTSAQLNIGSTANKIFVDQDQDTSYHAVGTIRISRIDWPSALKPIAAKMIWYQVDQAKPNGAIMERIDDYSVSFPGPGVMVGNTQYPYSLVSGLAKWRQARAQ